MLNTNRLSFVGLLPLSLLTASLSASCAADTSTESTSDEVSTTSQALKPSLQDCKSGSDSADRCRNQTDFVTARGGYYPRPMYRGAAEMKSDGTREVQESDVYRLSGKSLFVLNQARGFQVIDVAQQDRPRMIGRMDISGQPREMYLDTAKKRAYVLVDATPHYVDLKVTWTSRVAIVDYTNRTTPKTIGSVDIDGDIVESRRVGDVVYVVSNVWGSSDGVESAERTIVKSIYVGGNQPQVVDTMSFDGHSYQIHASDQYLFLGKYDGQQTAIDVYDISSPTGHITRGQAVSVPGYLQDKFSMSMDAAAGVLRVVSHAWDDSGTIYVKTFSVPTAATPTELGSLTLPNIGNLLATKFDGTKVYLVHMIRIDPLDVIDLSDPANPTRLSSLEIPGWLENLEVRGDRVVGIGMDNTTGSNRVAVAIYDVSDPTNTREMSRTLLGDEAEYQWTSFLDSRAFKMLDGRGLLLVPVSGWSQSSSFQTVQLVDVNLAGGVVQARGRVDQAGEANRSFGLNNRVGSLTHRQFTVANINDRDKPFVSGSVELSRNVVDFTKTNSAGIQLIKNWERPSELRAVPLSNSDAELPSVYSVLPFKDAERIFASGRDVIVLWHEWADGQQVTRLTSVDYSDPRRPVQRGELKLDTNGALYGYSANGAATQTEVMQVTGDLFVLAQDNGKDRNFELVSFANPSRPQVLSTASVPAQGELAEIRVLQDGIYVTTFEPNPRPEEPTADPVVDPADEPVDGTPLEMRPRMMPYRQFVETGKHFLTRIAFDRAGLAPSEPVNVPGVLVDVLANGTLVTLDQRVPAADTDHIDIALDTLKVNFGRGTAKLKDTLDIDDGVTMAMLRGSSVYYTTTERGPIYWCPPMARGCWHGGARNWTLHSVAVQGFALTETGTLLLQKNSSGRVLDIQDVGSSRCGFVTFGMGGFGLLNLSSSSAPQLTSFLPWNGWTTEVLVDTARHDATLWLGDSGVRTIALP